jgi:hypothetical protein
MEVIKTVDLELTYMYTRDFNPMLNSAAQVLATTVHILHHCNCS